MDNKKLSYFKHKLIKEKEDINAVIKNMENNFTTAPLNMRNSELSYYDNDSADGAGDLLDLEIGMTLEKNEEAIISKIDSALKNIENGTYGTCKCCGKAIPVGRLEILPYAENCVQCENDNHRDLNDGVVKRPIEESVIGVPFYKSNDFPISDAYDRLSEYNAMENTYEYYEDNVEYVDPMDLISNEEYKNTLN